MPSWAQTMSTFLPNANANGSGRPHARSRQCLAPIMRACPTRTTASSAKPNITHGSRSAARPPSELRCYSALHPRPFFPVAGNLSGRAIYILKMKQRISDCFPMRDGVEIFVSYGLASTRFASRPRHPRRSPMGLRWRSWLSEPPDSAELLAAKASQHGLMIFIN
jgi:hypothetical protein